MGLREELRKINKTTKTNEDITGAIIKLRKVSPSNERELNEIEKRKQRNCPQNNDYAR